MRVTDARGHDVVAGFVPLRGETYALLAAHAAEAFEDAWIIRVRGHSTSTVSYRSALDEGDGLWEDESSVQTDVSQPISEESR